MGGELKLISTFGWFGGDDNVMGANHQVSGPGDPIKAPSTYGWFFDPITLVAPIKLPTFLDATLWTTLEVRCT